MGEFETSIQIDGEWLVNTWQADTAEHAAEQVAVMYKGDLDENPVTYVWGVSFGLTLAVYHDAHDHVINVRY